MKVSIIISCITIAVVFLIHLTVGEQISNQEQSANSTHVKLLNIKEKLFFKRSELNEVASSIDGLSISNYVNNREIKKQLILLKDDIMGYAKELYNITQLEHLNKTDVGIKRSLESVMRTSIRTISSLDIQLTEIEQIASKLNQAITGVNENSKEILKKLSRAESRMERANEEAKDILNMLNDQRKINTVGSLIEVLMNAIELQKEIIEVDDEADYSKLGLAVGTIFLGALTRNPLVVVVCALSLPIIINADDPADWCIDSICFGFKGDYNKAIDTIAKCPDSYEWDGTKFNCAQGDEGYNKIKLQFEGLSTTNKYAIIGAGIVISHLYLPFIGPLVVVNAVLYFEPTIIEISNLPLIGAAIGIYLVWKLNAAMGIMLLLCLVPLLRLAYADCTNKLVYTMTGTRYISGNKRFNVTQGNLHMKIGDCFFYTLMNENNETDFYKMRLEEVDSSVNWVRKDETPRNLYNVICSEESCGAPDEKCDIHRKIVNEKDFHYSYTKYREENVGYMKCGCLFNCYLSQYWHVGFNKADVCTIYTRTKTNKERITFSVSVNNSTMATQTFVLTEGNTIEINGIELQLKAINTDDSIKTKLVCDGITYYVNPLYHLPNNIIYVNSKKIDWDYYANLNTYGRYGSKTNVGTFRSLMSSQSLSTVTKIEQNLTHIEFLVKAIGVIESNPKCTVQLAFYLGGVERTLSSEAKITIRTKVAAVPCTIVAGNDDGECCPIPYRSIDCYENQCDFEMTGSCGVNCNTTIKVDTITLKQISVKDLGAWEVIRSTMKNMVTTFDSNKINFRRLKSISIGKLMENGIIKLFIMFIIVYLLAQTNPLMALIVTFIGILSYSLGNIAENCLQVKDLVQEGYHRSKRISFNQLLSSLRSTRLNITVSTYIVAARASCYFGNHTRNDMYLTSAAATDSLVIVNAVITVMVMYIATGAIKKLYNRLGCADENDLPLLVKGYINLLNCLRTAIYAMKADKQLTIVLFLVYDPVIGFWLALCEAYKAEIARSDRIKNIVVWTMYRYKHLVPDLLDLSNALIYSVIVQGVPLNMTTIVYLLLSISLKTAKVRIFGFDLITSLHCMLPKIYKSKADLFTTSLQVATFFEHNLPEKLDKCVQVSESDIEQCPIHGGMSGDYDGTLYINESVIKDNHWHCGYSTLNHKYRVKNTILDENTKNKERSILEESNGKPAQELVQEIIAIQDNHAGSSVGIDVEYSLLETGSVMLGATGTFRELHSATITTPIIYKLTTGGVQGYAFGSKGAIYSCYHVTCGKSIVVPVVTNNGTTEKCIMTPRLQNEQDDYIVYGRSAQLSAPILDEICYVVNPETQQFIVVKCTEVADETSGSENKFERIVATTDWEIKSYSVYAKYGWSGLPIISKRGIPVGIYGNMKTNQGTNFASVRSHAILNRSSLGIDWRLEAIKLLDGAENILNVNYPTGSGKSTYFVLALAVELYKRKKHGTIVILNPLRAVPLELFAYMEQLLANEVTVNNNIVVHYSIGNNTSYSSEASIRKLSTEKVVILYMTYGKYLMTANKNADILLLDEVHVNQPEVMLTVDLSNRPNNILMQNGTKLARMTATPAGDLTDRAFEEKALDVTKHNEREYVELGHDMYFEKTRYSQSHKHLIFMPTRNACINAMTTLKRWKTNINVYTYYRNHPCGTGEITEFNNVDTGIMIATNAIESGITLINLTHVWDSRLEMYPNIDSEGNVNMSQRIIDRVSMIQRRGRAGRMTGKGYYYYPAKRDNLVPKHPPNRIINYYTAALALGMRVNQVELSSQISDVMIELTNLWGIVDSTFWRLMSYSGIDPYTLHKYVRVNNAKFLIHPDVLTAAFEEATKDSNLKERYTYFHSSEGIPYDKKSHYLFNPGEEKNGYIAPLAGAVVVGCSMIVITETIGRIRGLSHTTTVYLTFDDNWLTFLSNTHFDYFIGYTAKHVNEAMLNCEDEHIESENILIRTLPEQVKSYYYPRKPGRFVIRTTAGVFSVILTAGSDGKIYRVIDQATNTIGETILSYSEVSMNFQHLQSYFNNLIEQRNAIAITGYEAIQQLISNYATVATGTATSIMGAPLWGAAGLGALWDPLVKHVGPAGAFVTCLTGSSLFLTANSIVPATVAAMIALSVKKILLGSPLNEIGAMIPTFPTLLGGAIISGGVIGTFLRTPPYTIKNMVVSQGSYIDITTGRGSLILMVKHLYASCQNLYAAYNSDERLPYHAQCFLKNIACCFLEATKLQPLQIVIAVTASAVAGFLVALMKSNAERVRHFIASTVRDPSMAAQMCNRLTDNIEDVIAAALCVASYIVSPTSVITTCIITAYSCFAQWAANERVTVVENIIGGIKEGAGCPVWMGGLLLISNTIISVRNISPQASVQRNSVEVAATVVGAVISSATAIIVAAKSESTQKNVCKIAQWLWRAISNCFAMVCAVFKKMWELLKEYLAGSRAITVGHYDIDRVEIDCPPNEDITNYMRHVIGVKSDKLLFASRELAEYLDSAGNYYLENVLTHWETMSNETWKKAPTRYYVADNKFGLNLGVIVDVLKNWYKDCSPTVETYKFYSGSCNKPSYSYAVQVTDTGLAIHIAFYLPTGDEAAMILFVTRKTVIMKVINSGLSAEGSFRKMLDEGLLEMVESIMECKLKLVSTRVDKILDQFVPVERMKGIKKGTVVSVFNAVSHLLSNGAPYNKEFFNRLTNNKVQLKTPLDIRVCGSDYNAITQKLFELFEQMPQEVTNVAHLGCEPTFRDQDKGILHTPIDLKACYNCIQMVRTKSREIEYNFFNAIDDTINWKDLHYSELLFFDKGNEEELKQVIKNDDLVTTIKNHYYKNKEKFASSETVSCLRKVINKENLIFGIPIACSDVIKKLPINGDRDIRYIIGIIADMFEAYQHNSRYRDLWIWALGLCNKNEIKMVEESDSEIGTSEPEIFDDASSVQSALSDITMIPFKAPEGMHVVDVPGDGKCFWHAVLVCLKCLRPAAPYTLDDLIEDCVNYRAIKKLRKLEPKDWADPEIDGVAIAKARNIEIHLVEMQSVDDQMMPVHTIIDINGDIQQRAPDYNSHKQIHIIVHGGHWRSITKIDTQKNGTVDPLYRLFKTLTTPTLNITEVINESEMVNARIVTKQKVGVPHFFEGIPHKEQFNQNGHYKTKQTLLTTLEHDINLISNLHVYYRQKGIHVPTPIIGMEFSDYYTVINDADKFFKDFYHVINSKGDVMFASKVTHKRILLDIDDGHNYFNALEKCIISSNVPLKIKKNSYLTTTMTEPNYVVTDKIIRYSAEITWYIMDAAKILQLVNSGILKGKHVNVFWSNSTDNHKMMHVVRVLSINGQGDETYISTIIDGLTHTMSRLNEAKKPSHIYRDPKEEGVWTMGLTGKKEEKNQRQQDLEKWAFGFHESKPFMHVPPVRHRPRLERIHAIMKEKKLKAMDKSIIGDLFKYQKVLACYEKYDKMPRDATMMATITANLNNRAMDWHPLNSSVIQCSKDKEQILTAMLERMDRPINKIHSEIMDELIECAKTLKATNEQSLDIFTYEEVQQMINKQGAAGLFEKYHNMDDCLKDPKTRERVHDMLHQMKLGFDCNGHIATCHHKVESKVGKRSTDGEITDFSTTLLTQPPRLITYFDTTVRIMDWMVFGPYTKMHMSGTKAFHGSTAGTPIFEMGDKLHGIWDSYSKPKAATGDAKKWDHSMSIDLMMLECSWIKSHYKPEHWSLITNIYDHVIWSIIFNRLGFAMTTTGHRLSGWILTWHNGFINALLHNRAWKKTLKLPMNTTIEELNQYVTSCFDGDDSTHIGADNIITKENLDKVNFFMKQCGIDIRSGNHEGYRLHTSFETIDYLSHTFTPVPIDTTRGEILRFLPVRPVSEILGKMSFTIKQAATQVYDKEKIFPITITRKIAAPKFLLQRANVSILKRQSSEGMAIESSKAISYLLMYPHIPVVRAATLSVLSITGCPGDLKLENKYKLMKMTGIDQGQYVDGASINNSLISLYGAELNDIGYWNHDDYMASMIQHYKNCYNAKNIYEMDNDKNNRITSIYKELKGEYSKTLSIRNVCWRYMISAINVSKQIGRDSVRHPDYFKMWGAYRRVWEHSSNVSFNDEAENMIINVKPEIPNYFGNIVNFLSSLFVKVSQKNTLAVPVFIYFLMMLRSSLRKVGKFKKQPMDYRRYLSIIVTLAMFSTYNPLQIMVGLLHIHNCVKRYDLLEPLDKILSSGFYISILTRDLGSIVVTGLLWCMYNIVVYVIHNKRKTALLFAKQLLHI
ncbi:MAG: polyprotein [Hangzhou ochthera mantis flavivirus 1]|nr:MAG: polyprotein [Hangzhou ochthera mantis flavivirus 1]UHR49742.1 MAG: polyprotein [Hangzhou ochthera mantis flavivirus 1]